MKSITILRYQVDITDTFETPEGYTFDGAREALENALSELLKVIPGFQVSVKTIREETVRFNEVERVNASEQETVVYK